MLGSSFFGVVWILLALSSSTPTVQGQNDYDYNQDYQDYQDYANYQDGYGQEDNLYASYADRQAQKELGGAGGGGWGRTLAFGAFTWFVGGKIHSKRAVSKAKKRHDKEKQALYTQYYKDMLALQTQNSELAAYIDQLTRQQLDGEFEAADVDNDNKVSRAEFNMYKNRYLQKHPEMASQFPKFEDFDPDHNGLISKAEYDAYYKALGL